MKDFIFNSCDICTNPNEIKGGYKRFSFEIHTAYNGNAWVIGYDANTPTSGIGSGASRNDKKNYSCEQEAIEAAAKVLLQFFQKEEKNGMNIPSQIFSQLKELCGPPKPIQLTLFNF